MNRNKEIGERIQLRRQYLERRYPRQYTQDVIAAKLTEMGHQIGMTSVSHIERGRVTITAELLEKMAKVLQVPVQWFYGDEETSDTFAGEVIAAFNDTPELSQEAKDHVLRTIRLLQTR